MSIQLATRVTQIKPSPTMSVNARAQELKAAGKNIINLSVGEPDFGTPDFIQTAAIEAIEKGFTKYTPVEGIQALRQAIIAKFKKDNALNYELNQIIVSSGAKQSLYNLTQVLLDEGDEAIIPAPFWVSYPDMVKLAQAKPVIIEAHIEQNFKISAEQLEEAITDRTRLLLLNSPSNPSGMMYSKEELEALGEVLRKHPKIFIATDDIYEYILWGHDKFVNIVNACPDLMNRTLVINGMSKAYAMTGWRIGYTAGPVEIISAMKKIQSQSTSCANSIAQHASVAALNQDRSFFTPMLEAYKRRHDLVLTALKKMKGVQPVPSDGTFYLFPKVTEAISALGVEDDIAFAEVLLEKANIAVVPGTAFGLPGYIRLSCATSDENLQQAMNNMSELFTQS